MMKNVFARSDEQLLLEHRVGYLTALTELFSRYDRRYRGLAFSLAQNVVMDLDDSSLSDAHRMAFTEAVATFQFRQVRFLTYYCTLLKRELFSLRRALMKSLCYKDRNQDLIEGNEDLAFLESVEGVASLSFADNPAESYAYEALYAEAYGYRNKKKDLGPKIASFIRNGFSISEAAGLLGVKLSVAKNELRQFRIWVLGVVERSYNDPLLAETEKKTIERTYGLPDGDSD